MRSRLITNSSESHGIESQTFDPNLTSSQRQRSFAVTAYLLIATCSIATPAIAEDKSVGLEFRLPKKPERKNPFTPPPFLKELQEVPRLTKEAEAGSTESMYELAQFENRQIGRFKEIIASSSAELNQFRSLGGLPINAHRLQKRIGDANAAMRLSAKQAEQWFRRAAEANHAKSQFELATLLFEKDDDETAVTWARKAAAQQLAGAINLLGWAAEEGRGVEQDFQEAYSFYLKAAEAGCSPAMSNLAAALASGRGVQQDMEQAFRWYRKAGDNGEALGWYYAGMLKYAGEGTPQDTRLALELLGKAGDAGLADAMYWYASIAFDHKFYDKAIQWYAAGTRNGHAQSMTMAGLCFYFGLGTESNRLVAKDLWRRADSAGDEMAARFFARAERREIFELQDSVTLDDIARGREFLRMKNIE